MTADGCHSQGLQTFLIPGICINFTNPVYFIIPPGTFDEAEKKSPEITLKITQGGYDMV
jgi:hypothetical protein